MCVCPLSSLTALWTDLSPGSEQRSERRGSVRWGKCLRAENVRVHLAALGSGAVWIQVRRGVAG